MPALFQRDFGSKVNCCLNLLEQHLFTVERVKCIAIGVFCANDESHLNEVFAGVKDTADALDALTVHGLWDYQNLAVLERFFDVLSNESPNCIVKYREALSCCPLSNVVSTKLNDIIPPNNLFEKFAVSFADTVTVEEQYISYVSQLTASIANYLGINTAVFLLKTITNSPFEITWFFPMWHSQQIWDRTCDHKEWFSRQSVVSVTIGTDPPIKVCVCS